jgi:GH15 family glucan-1,4-alpha-glucosidase
METAALVGRDGSIDWLCLPRFDSGACLAALLGTKDHGRWIITPADAIQRVTRRYLPASLVLETEFTTATGVVRLVDCMPPRDHAADVIRIVEGVRGSVPMRMELIIRFDYGSIVPWVQRADGRLWAIGGPDAVSIWAPVPTHGADLTTLADFVVDAGVRLPFRLTWHPSHLDPPPRRDPEEAVRATERWWRTWCDQFAYDGAWRDQVLRSAITLKALTYGPTGGIVAAATTSLPERIGGVRNWDYRYCWLRDATFTLYALTSCGFKKEGAAWRDWLLRAVAGDPARLQIMYGARGERRLDERELPWLPGYEASVPVRIGNAAVTQRQLDVYGEVMDALYLARRADGLPRDAAWNLQRVILECLETLWPEPDEGIWEVRSARRHFTHSKVMAWLAFDRGIRAIERFGFDGPVDRWRAQRDDLHKEICRLGFDHRRGTFTQFYGSRELDASLLMVPLVGFLPADHPMVTGTVKAIEEHLLVDGFVHRYRTAEDGRVDGLPEGEGVFLPCSFWLADNYVLQGRGQEARTLFERLLALANDVGLLSEEYDPVARRLLGNFPQAFSHVSLINTAHNLSRVRGPASDRMTG